MPPGCLHPGAFLSRWMAWLQTGTLPCSTLVSVAARNVWICFCSMEPTPTLKVVWHPPSTKLLREVNVWTISVFRPIPSGPPYCWKKRGERGRYILKQWFSKWGNRIRSMSITWKLVRCADFSGLTQKPPSPASLQAPQSVHWVWGPPGDSHAQVWEPLF